MTALEYDAPFYCPPDPIVTVLEIPVPPSVNAIWRAKGNGVYRSKPYLDWIAQAGAAVLVDNKTRTRRTITGPFSAIIDMRRQRKGSDIDNRIKAVLDFCQLHQFVSDDSNCMWVRAGWSKDAGPRGCRVTLREEAPV